MITGTQAKQLKAFIDINRILMATRPEMPIGQLNTLLGVMLWGHQGRGSTPITMAELSERVGVPDSSISRHIRYLGDRERIGVPGCDWVQTYPWEQNRRQKVVTLNRKGEALAGSIGQVLQRCADSLAP